LPDSAVTGLDQAQPVLIEQSDESRFAAELAELKGLSAIGYLPLWRVEVKADGLEVGMSQLQANHFKYRSITNTAKGWCIKAAHNNIVLSLIIDKEITCCSMSRQVYPLKAQLLIEVQGQPKMVINGTALANHQKPLSPHPSDENSVFEKSNVTRKQIYDQLDHIRFSMIDGDYAQLEEHLNFPLRLNSSSDGSSQITDGKQFQSRVLKSISSRFINNLVAASYKDLYVQDDVIGFANGMLELKWMDNELKIITINKE
jgi:uncharacterized membrane protein